MLALFHLAGGFFIGANEVQAYNSLPADYQLLADRIVLQWRKAQCGQFAVAGYAIGLNML